MKGALRCAEAMVTYGEGVRAHFLGKLSRPQIAAMGENCRRISVGAEGRRAAGEARPKVCAGLSTALNPYSCRRWRGRAA